MRYNFLLGLAVLLLLGSCVANKKVTYLQNNDLQVKQVPLDSVVRSYGQAYSLYELHPFDVLYVNITSLTQKEFDVFQTGAGNQAVTGNNLNIFGKEVSPQGNISLPVLGDVKVEGMTIFQAKQRIDSLASAYVEDPVVNVRLLNFRFTVMGEVAAEGTFQTNNDKVTIIEALGIAGGLSELADRSKVKVIRQEAGHAHVYYLNLLKENIVENQHFYIHPNDIIVVPPLKQRPFRKYAGQNVSLIVSTVSLIVLVINLIKL